MKVNPSLPTPQGADRRSSVGVLKQRVDGNAMLPPEEDFLAIEDPLEIVLNYERAGQRVSRALTLTMRTPGHDADMIFGFLFSEGIIAEAADITSWEFLDGDENKPPTRIIVHLRDGLTYDPESHQRNFTTHSSCGVCGKNSLASLSLPASLNISDKTKINRDLIHQLPQIMRTSQPTFQKTGGLHAAALFSSIGELLVIREDIGRHNALDKVVGAALQSGIIPAPGLILCVSGRMSYEIVQKALVARIPIIAGVGAPSSLAVTLANDFHVTLLGFVRDNSYNIYSCPERLIG